MTTPHGGTDAGPRPRVDASTNANPLGPSPMARAAVAEAAIGPYPDPAYVATRRALADHHGLHVEEVVVGAGATELIHRLMHVLGGPVVIEAETFGEYAAAAVAHGHEVRRVTRHDEWAAALANAAVAFVASPGNPDGRIRSATWCDLLGSQAERTGTTLVWDLAYAPLVEEVVPVPRGAIRLHAPNKAHGCTGLRAGWLQAPAPLAERLRAAAVSWLVSTPGAAFLEASATAAADRWVAASVTTLEGWRDALAEGLQALGLEVESGDAPFVLARVPQAQERAVRLRTRAGVKVRDATSLGRPGWWRVAAQPPEATRLLLDGVAAVLDREAVTR